MTTYALVIDDTIQAVGGLPRGASRLTDRAWLQPLDEADAASCGYVAVVDTPRPADTDTTTHDRSVELVNGKPTVVWTSRAWTPDEQTARTAQANATTIDAAISAALAELDTLIAAPAMPVVPAGTFSTAQLSNYLRALRDEAQATRAGAQRVAATLKNTIRLVRGDFDDIG